MFDVSESTWLPSMSRATAKYSPSSTQKSRLNRRLRSAACPRARRRVPGPSRCSAPAVRLASSRRRRSPAARRSHGGIRAAARRGTRSSPRSLSSTGSRGRSPRSGAGTRRTRCRPVGVLIDPVQSRPRLAFELADKACVTGPALVLVEEHDIERRGVGGTVVRRVRALFEGRHLAVAHLVGDAPGILIAEVVDSGSLPVAEGAKRRGGELGRERERLQAGEDAVSSEHGHEPRQPGGRKRLPPSRDGR